ncbi:RNA recognition motif domain-containing protein [Paraglaciecola sp. 2405UD69-4]|uniref:RNA recognition motif domain-containing protein n=1 Tax=Paraglaciecola sp. 2405UD69-4 TaxID=3391836 RepID=UPI0039C8EE2D
MNPSFIFNIVIAIVIAVIMYFLLPIISTDISISLAAAIGALVGGVLTPLIYSLINSPTAEGETTNEISTLYVGNLPYRANEQAVQEYFEQQGKVVSVRLMKDRRTGKRKGYGFVEMDAKGANKAIKHLNDTSFQERTLKVRLAKDKVED